MGTLRALQDTSHTTGTWVKLVLLKTLGSAAAEQNCFLTVKIGWSSLASIGSLGSDADLKSLSQLQFH